MEFILNVLLKRRFSIENFAFMNFYLWKLELIFQKDFIKVRSHPRSQFFGRPQKRFLMSMAYLNSAYFKLKSIFYALTEYEAKKWFFNILNLKIFCKRTFSTRRNLVKNCPKIIVRSIGVWFDLTDLDYRIN